MRTRQPKGCLSGQLWVLNSSVKLGLLEVPVNFDGQSLEVLDLLGKASRTFCNDLEVASLDMHSVQFCRPLGCCFDELFAAMNRPGRGETLQTAAIEELYLLCGLLPLHWLDLRSKLNPTVYATDASLEGGGPCASTQLSVRGRAKCHLLCAESDGLEGGAADSLLLIEAFGGIGGLRKALELIGVLPQGIIMIDSDPIRAKLAKRHCAYVIVIDNIKKVTKEMVKQWRVQFARSRRVLLGGGWPCVNHASLNRARLGAAADSSLLLDDMVNIATWLHDCSSPVELPNWEVIELYENVVMDPDDLRVQSTKIGKLPS